MARDNYGHFINNEGVWIRVNTDKRGKDHIDFYDDCPVNNDDHKSIHIDYNSEILVREKLQMQLVIKLSQQM